MVAEGLACVNIRDVNFNKRDANAGERVAYGHAGVRVRSRINNDEMGSIGAGRLDFVDQRTFPIALKGLECSARFFRLLL